MPRNAKIPANKGNLFLLASMLGSVLTAVFRGKLPQVKILHGEINKGGQFAGSSCLREAFQVWTVTRVKEQLLCVHYNTQDACNDHCVILIKVSITKLS